MGYILKMGELFTQHVAQFDRMQWFWVSVVVLVAGFMCMRGFGSRTNY